MLYTVVWRWSVSPHRHYPTEVKRYTAAEAISTAEALAAESSPEAVRHKEIAIFAPNGRKLL